MHQCAVVASPELPLPLAQPRIRFLSGKIATEVEKGCDFSRKMISTLVIALSRNSSFIVILFRKF